ncbi:Glycine cleavage H-protein [Pilibacter termitis]|uniref:Glycine cleavage H-protein n=1 Tax=Pilibacter termitis TaxID=263852 RepID=A0A1T4LL76_9ENTE|nr:hypothetical protein [Pilibacter termitis]SJZ55479.1 Glycine cleavage H-protein [Pilibacter termitis]
MSGKIELTRDEWWIELSGKTARLGASEQLKIDIGEIYEATFSPIGAYLKKDEIVCELIAEKFNSKLPCPIEAVVIAFNEQALHNPAILNSKNRDENWLIVLQSERELSIADFL